MSQFRCEDCNQLQFKYRLKGDRLEIETKCYACNHFSYFTIWLNKLNFQNKDKHEENNKYTQ
jgi:phage FluMu protein Com